MTAMDKLINRRVFKPIEEANIEFIKIKNLNDEIGLVAGTNSLIATVGNLQPCYSDSTSTVTLTLQSIDEDPVCLPPSFISSTLSSPHTENKPPEKCNVTETNPGEYNITFTPSTKYLRFS